MTDELLPSDVSHDVGAFDRFAGWSSSLVSRAPFFAFCVLLVVAWLAQGVVTAAFRGLSFFLDPQYQLEVNTTTTIVTFLLVALLQNASARADKATQHKLNAVADGLSDLMVSFVDASPDVDCSRLLDSARELRVAVGVERRESS